VSPRLADVSELDTDVDVNRPDVCPSRICGHQILEQCFTAFHRTVSELELSKLADHLELWKQNIQRDGRPAEYRWRPLFNVSLADAHY